MNDPTYSRLVLDVLASYLQEAHRQQQQGLAVDQQLINKARFVVLELSQTNMKSVGAATDY